MPTQAQCPITPGSWPTVPRVRQRPGLNETSHHESLCSGQGLDWKASIARRSSLPAVSHFNSRNFVTSQSSCDPPLHIFVQAGTLNHLVHILVHVLEHISVSV